MRLSEAIELLESEGLLLERIKKYRTTPEERRFRDNRSSTDKTTIKENPSTQTPIRYRSAPETCNHQADTDPLRRR